MKSPSSYVTSDLHFAHNKEFIWKERGFNSIQEHDDFLIARWNEQINSNDKIYILGDIIFKQSTQIDSIMPKLKGNKILLLGNHEHHNMQKYIPYFSKIYSILITKQFIFSHFPVHTHELQMKRINIHGHIHKNINTNIHSLGKLYYNVNIEFHNLKFVSFYTLNEYYNKIMSM